jgi:hypothetical protein
VNFVVECYCGVEEVRSISADFAAPGVFGREPLSNLSPDKLIFALSVFARQQLSLLVSNGARGLCRGKPARSAWIWRFRLVVFSLTPAPGALSPVFSLPASNHITMLAILPEGSRPDGC